MNDFSDSKSTDSYRIALAARSAIYAPFFAAVQNANGKGSQWSFVSDKSGHAIEFGDRKAYKILAKGEAEIVVCDPMVVAEDAATIERDQSRKDTAGVIVGFVLSRPALWLIKTNAKCPVVFRRGDSDFKDSLPYLTQHERAVELGNMAVYANCTASMILDYMSTGKRPYWTVARTNVIPLGDENLLLSANPPAVDEESEKPFPHFVITCDGLLAAEHRPSTEPPEYKCKFAWHRSAVIPDFPFTAVVCRRDWLRGWNFKHQWQLRKLLSLLQHAVESLQPNAKQDLFQETIDRAMEGLATAARQDLLNGRKLDPNNGALDHYKTRFERCVKDLYRIGTETGGVRSSYPRCITPDWCFAWVRSGWLFSVSKLWDIVENASHSDARRVFENCSTPLLAPKRRRLASYFWHCREMLLSVNSIVAAFLGALLITAIIASISYFFKTPSIVSNRTDSVNEATAVAVGWVATLKSLWWPPDSVATGLAILIWAFLIYPCRRILRLYWKLFFPKVRLS